MHSSRMQKPRCCRFLFGRTVSLDSLVFSPVKVVCNMYVANFRLRLVDQMFFATSILHVHLMQWDDVNLVEGAVNKCNEVWESIQPDKVSQGFVFIFLMKLWLDFQFVFDRLLL